LGKYDHQFTQEYFMPSFDQFAKALIFSPLYEKEGRMHFLVNGKRKTAVAAEIRIRHLTGNLLIGFYPMGG
jgi:hypothetical protein